MSLPSVQIDVTDTATPVLAKLMHELTDRSELHEAMAVVIEEGTRQYIRQAADTRHSTADRLQAAPTGYLTKRAELTQAVGTPAGVTLTVVGAIFRRVFGPVLVRPREKKMLAIPWRAAAYGKRPGEFSDLFVYVSKRGQAFLARKEGDKLQFYFLLKSKVLLPQDRGLLPSNAQFGAMGGMGARGYLNKITAAIA